MSLKDVRTHIMLDLELAGHPSNNNPAIIQIGAIHFDIHSGQELRYFSMHINLQSNLDMGLKTDNETLSWLQNNIPQTLQASQNSPFSLPSGLIRFTKWLNQCLSSTKSKLTLNGEKYEAADLQPMIWSNGSMQDGRWIDSAYRACGIPKPWNFYNDLCVRTYNEATLSLTGRDFRREGHVEFRDSGKKHNAIEDCKNQIRYLINCRNAFLGAGGDRDGNSASASTSFSSDLRGAHSQSQNNYDEEEEMMSRGLH